MASIETRKARLLATERLVQVMRAQYATELAALNDEPNLPLPAPTDAGYYLTPEDPDDVLGNHNVFCFFTATDGRSLDDQFSGGITGNHEWRSFDVACVVMFRTEIHEPVTRTIGVAPHDTSKKLTEKEVMQYRSEYYVGAMIETIEKYAEDGDTIHEINCIDDAAELYVNQERQVFGMAAAQFRVKQKTLTPRSQPLP